MIDLRSDTVSKPTEAMRQAMAAAEVGDDVYGDDPTVRALEARVAELLGKEDAVYTATGTLANQVALRSHTEAGDQVLVEESAHVYLLEGGAPAALSGLTLRHLPGERGVFGARQVTAALPTRHAYMPETVRQPVKLLCVENTHNVAGGTVWPLDAVRDVTAAARDHGLATHMDGARLWNAAARSGVAPADYAAHFDSVSVCFSKGLGAPLGSALAGTKDFVRRARRFKQGFGGGFRQAGIVAAGALHALEHHRERLVEDHENAERFAAGLAQMPGVEIDLEAVQTNIVRFALKQMTAADFAERCHAKGVYILPSSAQALRAVFHLDVSRADAETALGVIRDVLREGE